MSFSTVGNTKRTKGLYGAFFIRFNMAIAQWRKSSQLRFFPILEVFLVAITTALINYPIIFMRSAQQP